MAASRDRNKKPSVWPWVGGLVVLGALIVLLILRITAPLPPVVQEYLATCTDDDDDDDLGLDHEYTSQCIRLLGASIDLLVEEDSELPEVYLYAELLEAYRKAERLQESPDAALVHANLTRDVFVSVATLMDTIQGARYPDLDSTVYELEEAAREVRADVELLEQEEAIHAFFRAAGEVLRRMAG